MKNSELNIKRRVVLFMACVGWCMGMMAQQFEKVGEPCIVKTHSFWSDWFVQADLDMSLQNPYGYNFSKVFPNGKSFGLDVAVGKWFSPMVGYRGKINWENALPLLKNDHANWLAPFNEPGVNREKGGYIAFYGDVLLNLHNIFGTYREDRTWNLNLYPRIGVNYNFGVSKGSLLAGVGFLNTYRLNSRWSLIADVAYVFSGSGFVGSKDVERTGVGSNSNGYFSIGLGAQMDLGKVKKDQNTASDNPHRVLTNGIWDNWFLQAGLDMSLMNPYRCNFSQVFPKGKTFGLNVAAGKWFTPEIALRGRVQWENGLFKNGHLEWVAPKENPEKNYEGGGLATIALDAMLNLTNVIKGYDPMKKWHTSAFIRAGIINQFEEGSGSPLMGVGVEQTFRLSNRLSLFGSAAYQVTTSEGLGVKITGKDSASGSNGFFDIDLGLVFDLGNNKF